MTTQKHGALLGPDDPAPVVIDNPGGASPFLLLGDHAGTAIPASLGTLGLSPADMARHIACDIGVRGLGRALAPLLDAPFIHQAYSRVVIDCNRDPLSAQAVPSESDGTIISQNQYVTPKEVENRIAAIHAPYQQVIAKRIECDPHTDGPNILVSLHSFTPVMAGEARPWHVGVLHGGGNATFALAVLRALRALDRFPVGDNAPYRMDATDHTVPRHAFDAGLPYVELEVRQDLIADTDGQRAWAHILADVLLTARGG